MAEQKNGDLSQSSVKPNLFQMKDLPSLIDLDTKKISSKIINSNNILNQNNVLLWVIKL